MVMNDGRTCLASRSWRHMKSLSLIIIPLLFVSQSFAQGFNFVRQLPATWWDFDTPHGVAIDSDGNVYVVDSGSDRIAKFDSTGMYITHWGTSGTGNGQFSSPFGIAVDGNGNVFVADTDNRRIQVFTSDGVFVRKWGSPGIGNGQFRSPGGVAVDSAGNVYVTDEITLYSGFGTPPSNRIQKFTGSGQYLAEFGNGYGSGDGQFNGIGGIAIAPNGDLYAADLGNRRIQWFSAGGQHLGGWGISGAGGGGFGSSYFLSIAVDTSSFVYVADGWNNQFSNPFGTNRVQKFLANGDFVDEWGTAGVANSEFNGPTGIAIDNENKIYVTDGGNHRLQKFSSDGLYALQWGRAASDDEGHFNSPRGISLDPSGNVFVADTQNNRIQQFDSDGNFVRTWGSEGSADGEFDLPWSVVSNGAGAIFISDGFNDNSGFIGFGTNHRVQRFNASGQFVSQWGTSGSGDSQFSAPTGLALDNLGNVFVVDTLNNRVQVFDDSAQFVRKWGASGSGNEQFDYPVGIALDTIGNVYVADSENYRIQKFNASTGAYIRQWGTNGTGIGQFKRPAGVATDSGGNVFVADSENNRIQKFSGNGDARAQWSTFDSIVGPLRDPHGVAVDETGNIYVADSDNNRILVFKPAPLTVTLSSAAPNPTKSTIAVTVTFSESVSDFVAGDVTTSNAVLSNFAGSGTTYTFTLTAGAQGLVTAAVLENVAHNLDEAGNFASGLFSRTFDSIGPDITMTTAASDPTNDMPITVSVTFNEAVSGFSAADVTVQNATLQNLTENSASNYTFDLFPTIAAGSVSATIAQGVCVDLAGNSNSAQNLTRTYDSIAPPAPLILTDGGNGPGADFETSAASTVLNGSVLAGSATSVLVNGNATGVTYVAGSASWQATISLLQFGDNVFSITAADAAGNVSVPDSILVSRAPEDDIFVSDEGSDSVSNEGTEDEPWHTVPYAVSVAAPFASADNPITVNLAPGIYSDQVVLEPYVFIKGSDPNNPASTVIEYFDANDPAGPNQHVVVVGAEGAGVQDLLITVPDGLITEPVVLLKIDNVAMEVNNVVLDGNDNPDSTGIVAIGTSSSDSIIRNSTIQHVNVGLSATDSGIKVTRTLFDSVLGDAVVVEEPATKLDGDTPTPLLGAAGTLTTGLNRFRNITGAFVRSGSPTQTLAQNNDWGVYTANEIEAKLEIPAKLIVDQINYDPWLGRPLIPACVVVDLFDSETLLQVPDSESPDVTVGQLSTERDSISLLWIFPAVTSGNYSITGTATDYVQAVSNVNVTASRIYPVSISLIANDNVGDINADGRIDAIDIQFVINAALGLDVGLLNGDVNGDGDVNAVDVQIVINVALGL